MSMRNKKQKYPLITVILLTAFLTVSQLSTFKVVAVEEDPFNYTGKYIIDSTKLNDNEKTALPYVQKYALNYGLSPALIMALIKKESNFDPNAVGDIGLKYPAYGYMQVRWPAVDDISRNMGLPAYTPEQWANPNIGRDKDINIKYGSAYIILMKNRWGNSMAYTTPNNEPDVLRNTISSYNAGHPTVDNCFTYVEPVLGYYGSYKNKYILASVGGVVVSVDKFGLLAPYLGLTSSIIVAEVATAIYVKRVKRRKEKQ